MRTHVPTPEKGGDIAALNTAAMWKAGYLGKGVVVASIDSGVRWTHEAVKSNYRGLQNSSTVNHDYSFWDGIVEQQSYTYLDFKIFETAKHLF